MLELKSKNYSFVLLKGANGKFVQTSKNPNAEGVLAKYLVAECTDPEASRAYGVQTRRIVKTFYEGTKIYDDLIEGLKAKNIDNETGVSSKPLAGYFVDIPCGFQYATEYKGRTFISSSVSIFIMAGENFHAAKDRAIRGAEKTRITDSDPIDDDFQQNTDKTTP